MEINEALLAVEQSIANYRALETWVYQSENAAEAFSKKSREYRNKGSEFAAYNGTIWVEATALEEVYGHAAGALGYATDGTKIDMPDQGTTAFQRALKAIQDISIAEAKFSLDTEPTTVTHWKDCEECYRFSDGLHSYQCSTRNAK